MDEVDEEELSRAREALATGKFEVCFAHLERASRLWMPSGNSGRARVSAFKPMPVPEDLRHLVP